MLLRPDALDCLTDRLPFLSSSCRLATAAGGWACLIVLLIGCASTTPRPRDEPLLSPLQEAPLHEVAAIRAGELVSGDASAATPPTESWSSQSRKGREALLEAEFETAEAFFRSALEESKTFRSRDVRVDVSFGNLVRLASVYERIGRSHDAKRLLEWVMTSAGQRRIGTRRITRYQARYETLIVATLDPRLEPGSGPKYSSPRTAKGPAPYDRLIRNAAHSFDVDPALVKAVVAAESNFEPRAVSRVGAQGLMQLMPATARAMGVRRPFKPSENIRGGVRYLRSLLDRFEEVDLALAAYNAGPEAVVRHGGIPPYPETEAYVSKVLSHYRRYQARFSH